MRNTFFVSRIREALMLLILIFTFLSCFAFGGEFSSEKIDKINKKYEETAAWYEKYLYFEMSEDEFVSLFTKDRLTDDPDKPYIINHKNNSYIVKDSKGAKYRITFENGLLVKFEKYSWEKIPLITAAYYDYTHFLRGSEIRTERTKNIRGFYVFMPEEEFLKTFSNSILSRSKLRDGGNYYVFIGKDGEKYRVSFSPEGYLIGMH